MLRKKFILCLPVIIIGSFLNGHAQLESKKNDTAFLHQLNVFDTYYPFIKYDQNFVEWYHETAILPFFYKLNHSGEKKVKVLHIGDSHVQNDFYTGHVRMRLQELFGYAGRGFCFPYQCADTYAAYDYETVCFGDWNSAKSTQETPEYPVGITGVTIHTDDPEAGFLMAFHSKYETIRPDFTKIKVYYKTANNSFSLVLKTCDSCFLEPVRGKNYLEFTLTQALDSLCFLVQKTAPEQSFFECYGIHVETPTDNGILYSTVGINDAGYRSLLSETLLPAQLAQYQPDLVVLDLGANDFYTGGFSETEMRKNLENLMTIIKKNAPFACILVVNSQDIYSGKNSVQACVHFSKMTRETAQEKGCALYDYFNVSGGQYAMLKWSDENLARKDRFHLTALGYLLKGDLFVNALLNSYRQYLSGSFKNGLHISNFKVESEHFKIAEKISKSETPLMIPVSQKRYHTVRSGESLGLIARKYGTTVAYLKSANRLKSDMLQVGQTLAVGTTTIMIPSAISTSKPASQPPAENPVPVPAKPAAPATVQPLKPATATPPPAPKPANSTGKIVYTIKKGDVLGSIAARYKVSVVDLKKWNNLKSDQIAVGKTLTIYPKK